MPPFSFRLPRFLRSRRSQHSDPPEPSPTSLSNDVTASYSTYPGTSPTLSSHHPVQAAHTTPNTSHSLASTDLQNSTGHVGVDRSPGNCGDQPTVGSLTILPSDVVDPNSALQLSPDDSIAQPPCLPDIAAPTQSQHQPCSVATTLSQQSSIVEQQGSLVIYSPPSELQNQSMFTQAHNLSASGNFINGNVGNITLTNHFHNLNFMEKLLEKAIPGAAADSSARDPPPRCHPGTRLAILKRCLRFVIHCNGVKKMRWVVGVAGVGKSAIMQSVTESPELEVASDASVFFSVNGRNDGAKAILTLCYQFAAKLRLYRQVIENEISDDPSLLQSSLAIQFEKFIIEPFIHNSSLNSIGRMLIIVDGLDECANTHTQVELLRLISSFCISYPSSPIAWLIASRPEPHINSFFSSPEVVPAYEKDEIPVDSDEARADVERFLRQQLSEIGTALDFLGSQWPDDRDLWKVANAAGGLFAYAQAVVRYIGDSNTGDPMSQLFDVLSIIDAHPISDSLREQHPMAHLDALYSRILSNVPPKIMINARKFFLLLASDWNLSASIFLSTEKNFIVMCNWLGMTADEAYVALNYLRSVLSVPRRNEAHMKALEPHHKSLMDYISRSSLFSDIALEAQQLKTQCAFRVLREAPSGVGFVSGVDYEIYSARLARNGGPGDDITITWPADEGADWDDDETRLNMYMLAVGEAVAGKQRGDPAFQTESYINLFACEQ